MSYNGKIVTNEEDLFNFYIEDIEFSGIGYKLLRSTNQINYKTSPTRQDDGSMLTIHENNSFTLPSVEIGFNLVDITQYQKLRSLLLRKRTFKVKYFDIDFHCQVEHEMYAQPDELKNFFNLGNNIIGLQNFKLTFVATLNEDTLYTVTIKQNGTEQVLKTIQAKWGRSIILPKIEGYSFYDMGDNFADNSQGVPQQAIFTNDENSKIIWKPKESFNVYGNITIYANE